MEESLGAHIGFCPFDHFPGAARHFHVADCFSIHWEVTHRRAIFRSHIAYGCAVSKGHEVETFTIELNKFINNPLDT